MVHPQPFRVRIIKSYENTDTRRRAGAPRQWYIVVEPEFEPILRAAVGDKYNNKHRSEGVNHCFFVDSEVPIPVGDVFLFTKVKGDWNNLVYDPTVDCSLKVASAPASPKKCEERCTLSTPVAKQEPPRSPSTPVVEQEKPCTSSEPVVKQEPPRSPSTPVVKQEPPRSPSTPVVKQEQTCTPSTPAAKEEKPAECTAGAPSTKSTPVVVLDTGYVIKMCAQIVRRNAEDTTIKERLKTAIQSVISNANAPELLQMLNVLLGQLGGSEAAVDVWDRLIRDLLDQ